MLRNRSQAGADFAALYSMSWHSRITLVSGCIARHNPNNAFLRRQRAPLWTRRRHKRQHLSARGAMVAGGGPTHAPVIIGTAGTPIFNRCESPTQTRNDAAQQVASMEVWGAAAQGSPFPSVKAWRNATRPPSPRGIEFCTTIPTTPGTGTPYEARWYQGSAGVINKTSTHVGIPVYYIKNTQVP